MQTAKVPSLVGAHFVAPTELDDGEDAGLPFVQVFKEYVAKRVSPTSFHASALPESYTIPLFLNSDKLTDGGGSPNCQLYSILFV